MKDQGKGVPWSVSLEEKAIAEYAGVKLGDYYFHPEIMLEGQLKAKKKLEEHYGIGRFVKIHVPTFPCLEASVLGVKVIFPEDNEPWPEGPIIRDIKEAKKLKILNPYKKGLMAKNIQTYHYIKKRVGNKYTVEFRGYEGPITTALIIRGANLLLDMYDHPQEVHKLLGLVTETSLLIRKLIKEVTKNCMETTWILDDYAGLLTPQQYEEFALPYYKKIYDEFGLKGRFYHCELLRKEHLQSFLSSLNMSWFNPGVNKYLSIKDILEVLGPKFTYEFTLEWRRKETPQVIKERYRKIAEDKPPEIAIAIIQRVPSEILKAVIEVANDYEITSQLDS